MAGQKIVIEVTPAQAQAINAALAYVTAGEPEDGGMASQREFNTTRRARVAVQDAMKKAGVSA